MEFKTIVISNPEWDNYINSSINYDFHHTSCLHKIEVTDKEEALLFVAKAENDFIAFPLLIKPVTNTNYFDATSVYGYGGPVASRAFSDIPEELNAFFKTQFLNHCVKNNIIAVFSRLHPLINSGLFFNQFGVCINLNKTVAIDLSLSVREQRKEYRKSNKSEINQLKKKKGYTAKIVESTDKESIKRFVTIYHETMRRVNARESYFFNFNYFNDLLANSCFNCHLIAAYKGNTMAAGAIFPETKTIMQYHLAGTNEAYIKDTPMKLILDKARLLSNDKKLRYFHLGGGVGGSDEDSLFRFKAGFSKNFFQFSVWNLVVNEDVYNRLVNEKGVKKEDHPNFFPLYRANN